MEKSKKALNLTREWEQMKFLQYLNKRTFKNQSAYSTVHICE
jgi:hypothetical protein